jgi:hypothetical protein
MEANQMKALPSPTMITSPFLGKSSQFSNYKCIKMQQFAPSTFAYLILRL